MDSDYLFSNFSLADAMETIEKSKKTNEVFKKIDVPCVICYDKTSELVGDNVEMFVVNNINMHMMPLIPRILAEVEDEILCRTNHFAKYKN